MARARRKSRSAVRRRTSAAGVGGGGGGGAPGGDRAEAAAGTTRSASQPTAGMPGHRSVTCPSFGARGAGARAAGARRRRRLRARRSAAISSMFGGCRGGPLSEPTEVAPKGATPSTAQVARRSRDIRDIDNKMPQQKTPTRQPDVPASRLHQLQKRRTQPPRRLDAARTLLGRRGRRARRARRRRARRQA